MHRRYREGKLITIDGVDGVGKNTQSKLLVDYIKKVQGDCGFFSFPRYETPTGKLVGEYLKSGRTDLNILQRAELYSQDRAAARLEIINYLMQGIDVVCDRYVDSNCAYFTSFAKMEKGVAANYDIRVKHFIEELEYKQLCLPRADKTFILSMPLDESRRQVLHKDKRHYTDDKLDLHERDDILLGHVQEYYNAFAFTKQQHYSFIDCRDPDTKAVRSKESIHKEIVEIYNSLYSK